MFTLAGHLPAEVRSVTLQSEIDKVVGRIAPMLGRILIVDPRPMGARLISDLMRQTFRSQIEVATTLGKALAAAESFNPTVIFVEMSGPGFDGAVFTRALRRSHLPCRQAPVIMTTPAGTAAEITAARDAGVHEFLRKPFTTKDLLRRLAAVTLMRRDWIEAVVYVGPDRRRFNSGDYTGPLKRGGDEDDTPDALRIRQALKILKAAVDAVAHDPVQALRSMQAQAADLQRTAAAVGDTELAKAALDYRRYLASVDGKPLIATDVAVKAAPLLAMRKKAQPPPAAKAKLESVDV